MKNILRVHPIYNFIIALFGLSFCIFFYFIPTLGEWAKGGYMSYAIIWYIMVSCGVCFMLYVIIYSLQFAVINKQGIKIYLLFVLVANIKWDMIHNITQENLAEGRYALIGWLFE